MSDIIVGLKQKRRIIEQFQRDQAKQEGQEMQMLKQLKDEHDADSVEIAEVKIGKLREELVESEKFLEELDTEMDQIIHNAVPGSSSGAV